MTALIAGLTLPLLAALATVALPRRARRPAALLGNRFDADRVHLAVSGGLAGWPCHAVAWRMATTYRHCAPSRWVGGGLGCHDCAGDDRRRTRGAV